jgi:hypothetical protein
MPGRWNRYIDAANRKVEIAAFHFEQLSLALPKCPPPHDGRPDVPTQAFFEGLVVASIAAVDQVAQAANSALDLGLSGGNLFEGAAPQIESRVPEFRCWRTKPIGLDLRRLRVRMIHYSYEKSAAGDPSWQVEIANPAYTGSRDLLAYANAALEHFRELAVIARKLETALEAELARG